MALSQHLYVDVLELFLCLGKLCTADSQLRLCLVILLLKQRQVCIAGLACIGTPASASYLRAAMST